jgi:hypothetical protein
VGNSIDVENTASVSLTESWTVKVQMSGHRGAAGAEIINQGEEVFKDLSIFISVAD